jgi:FkbM family methyltransferase
MVEFTKMDTINYLYVGAHVGNTKNDYLFQTNVENKTIVLIEPVPYLFNELKDNYKQKQEKNLVSFLNIAVSNKDDMLTLYIPSEKNNFPMCPDYSTQLASVNPAHISDHVPWMIVDKIEVPCFTLNTILKNMETTAVDNLITDTEGHDYDILMNLDLDKIKPKTIRFEHYHMDGTFTTGEKYEALISHLKNNGYTVTEKDRMDTLVTLSESTPTH